MGKAKFITPPNKLKTKVGGGGIATERLEKAQEYINFNTIDFMPHAETFLEQAQEQVKLAANNNFEPENLIRPIMQLKANGGMFQYYMISDVANSCLNFVENLEDAFNKDAADIIQAHIDAITTILKHQMSGNGGKEGKALIKELEKACKRYHSKYK